MSNDLDFDVMVSEISERVATIREPQVVVTIEKWVNKLVAEPRGPNELNYLKLLNRMMNNKRVGPPFLRPPPAGPLFPLSRYINPRPCDGRPPTGQTALNWYSSSQNRSVQTAVADRTPSPTPSAVPSLSSTDGHLPAGGCPCGIKTKPGGGKSRARSDNDVCNPCLDKVLRTADQVCAGLPDEYNDLLGDCTLPTFTEEEQRTVGPELLRVLKIIDDTTTLQDFYFQVSQYTCDKGAMLMKVADAMMAEFEAFVTDVFESRAQHISDGLAKEQLALSDKYTFLARRSLNRATMAMDYLKEQLPVFNWDKYNAEPESYMQKMIASASAVQARGGGRGPAGDDEMQSADGGDDDPQHAANKKLLYTLNWMRTEVNRMDCECQALYDQRKCLTNSLSALNAKLSTTQCQSSADIGQLKDELTVLRSQSANQSKTIDRLMETIQLTILEVIGTGHTSQLLELAINPSLMMVSNWMEEHGLKISHRKTVAIVMTSKRNFRDPVFILHNEPINLSRTVRYLGVELSSNLGFREHLLVVKNKASRTAGALGRLMPNVGGPKPAKRVLLTSVVHSQLLYASPVWDKALVFQRTREVIVSP
ncbi:uncharacterized protein LOC126847657 [Adelges cooleyi]|uniref:uncharacterized protein LOC126847657 n=1 Tax=Adelges cooleyi TaxID=133065 RepID=UPI0021808616|nr:uncharacterized protein LOC126847657 [Adelges cooleyi]